MKTLFLFRSIAASLSIKALADTNDQIKGRVKKLCPPATHLVVYPAKFTHFADGRRPPDDAFTVFAICGSLADAKHAIERLDSFNILS